MNSAVYINASLIQAEPAGFRSSYGPVVYTVYFVAQLPRTSNTRLPIILITIHLVVSVSLKTIPCERAHLTNALPVTQK